MSKTIRRNTRDKTLFGSDFSCLEGFCFCGLVGLVAGSMDGPPVRIDGVVISGSFSGLRLLAADLGRLDLRLAGCPHDCVAFSLGVFGGEEISAQIGLEEGLEDLLALRADDDEALDAVAGRL